MYDEHRAVALMVILLEPQLSVCLKKRRWTIARQLSNLLCPLLTCLIRWYFLNLLEPLERPVRHV